MDRRSIRLVSAAAAVALVATLTSCVATTTDGPVESTPTTEPRGDVSGLVQLDSAREVFMTCRGEGSPTVILIAGGGLAADSWSTLAPGSPDIPVMDAIAETNRVCAYDRPGTTRVTGEPSRSDPVELPRTLTELADELDAVLAAADEPGPYVLVGHSFGSAIGRLYAGLHPDAVAGMVWVDGGHEAFYEVFRDLIGPAGYDIPGVEYDLPPTIVEMREQFTAHPVPPVPSTVIEHSHDRALIPNPMGWPEQWPIGELEVAWRAAQSELVTLVPDTDHIVAERSGHLIMVEQVDLVIDSIRDVLARVGGAE